MWDVLLNIPTFGNELAVGMYFVSPLLQHLFPGTSFPWNILLLQHPPTATYFYVWEPLGSFEFVARGTLL